MLPTLARLRIDPPHYGSVYLRIVGQLLLVTQPGIVFAIATADIFIPILLGEKWRGPRLSFSGWGRGPPATDQRRDELAVHQSTAKQGVRLVGVVQRRDQRLRILCRLALGADWCRSRLFRYAGSLALPGRVLDGDANRTGETGGFLWRRNDPCPSQCRLVHVDHHYALGDIARRRSRSRLLLCLSYGVTVLALALIPAGRKALRESLSMIAILAS